MTFALDLGRFVLDSSTEALSDLSDEEAAVYLPFKLAVRNVSAYLVDGTFEWDHVGRDPAVVLKAADAADSISGVSSMSCDSEAWSVPIATTESVRSEAMVCTPS